MDDNQQHPKPPRAKRLFTSLALACVVICIPLAFMAAGRVGRGENMTGSDGLGIAISAMAALLLSGLILGQIGLFRGEKPRFLPAGALALNAGAFLYLILHMPR